MMTAEILQICQAVATGEYARRPFKRLGLIINRVDFQRFDREPLGRIGEDTP